jgi:hypothetical protein
MCLGLCCVNWCHIQRTEGGIEKGCRRRNNENGLGERFFAPTKRDKDKDKEREKEKDRERDKDKDKERDKEKDCEKK